jgi:hypothetical protein
MLEAGNGTKFQLFPLFNVVGPFLGLTRNLVVMVLVMVATFFNVVGANNGDGIF